MSQQVELDTFVGPVVATDGSGPGVLRQDRQANLTIAQAHAPYYEQSSRGQVFCATTALTGATVTSGQVAPPAAAAATLLSILNPLGSGVNLEIIRGVLGHISGTPGVGSFGWCAAYQADLVTATTNITAAGLYLSSKQSVTKCWSATALTGGVVHRTVAGFPSAQFGGAIAATTPMLAAVDEVNGIIVVPPGWMITVAPPATGTSHVLSASVVWAETPIAAA